MAGQLRLSEPQLSDFRTLVSLRESEIRSIFERLNGMGSVPMSQSEIRSAINGAIPGNPKASSALTRQLLGLAGLQYRSDVSGDELLPSLRKSLEDELDSTQLDAWDQISSLFGELLSTQAIRTTVKSLDLLYDYA